MAEDGATLRPSKHKLEEREKGAAMLGYAQPSGAENTGLGEKQVCL